MTPHVLRQLFVVASGVLGSLSGLLAQAHAVELQQIGVLGTLSGIGGTILGLAWIASDQLKARRIAANEQRKAEHQHMQLMRKIELEMDCNERFEAIEQWARSVKSAVPEALPVPDLSQPVRPDQHDRHPNAP